MNYIIFGCALIAVCVFKALLTVFLGLSFAPELVIPHILVILAAIVSIVYGCIRLPSKDRPK
jgi:hypothetical protein